MQTRKEQRERPEPTWVPSAGWSPVKGFTPVTAGWLWSRINGDEGTVTWLVRTDSWRVTGEEEGHDYLWRVTVPGSFRFLEPNYEIQNKPHRAVTMIRDHRDTPCDEARCEWCASVIESVEPFDYDVPGHWRHYPERMFRGRAALRENGMLPLGGRFVADQRFATVR